MIRSSSHYLPRRRTTDVVMATKTRKAPGGSGRPFEKGSKRAIEAGRRGGKKTAASRRKCAGPYKGSILDAMDDAGLTDSSWDAWRTVMRATFGLPLPPGNHLEPGRSFSETRSLPRRMTGRCSCSTGLSAVSQLKVWIGRRNSNPKRKRGMQRITASPSLTLFEVARLPVPEVQHNLSRWRKPPVAEKQAIQARRVGTGVLCRPYRPSTATRFATGG